MLHTLLLLLSTQTTSPTTLLPPLLRMLHIKPLLYAALSWQLEKKALLAKVKDNFIEKVLALAGVNVNLDSYAPSTQPGSKREGTTSLLKNTTNEIKSTESSNKLGATKKPTASTSAELLPQFIKEKIIGKELIDKRTEDSKTYQKPDGTFTTLFSIVPLHYKEKGKWKEINKNFKAGLEPIPDQSSFQATTHSTFSSSLPKPAPVLSQEIYKITEAPYNLVIGKNFNQPVRFKASGKQIVFKYKDSNPVQAEVSGDRALYRDAYKDTDVERYAINEGLKENIILKSPSAPLTFTEEIATSLRLKLDDPDGTSSLIFYNDTSPVAVSPHPFVTDASGKMRFLKWSLESKGGKHYLI